MLQKPLVCLIHGFNVWDKGKGTVGKLRPYIEAEGFEVLELPYRWIGVIQTYFYNRVLAKRFAKRLKGRKVILVAHSNGNVIANIMVERYGVQAEGLVAINPALDRDTKFPQAYKFIHVYHNKGDVATRIARFIPAHAWGEMGSVGYIGGGHRAINFDTAHTKGMSHVWGHSDIFENHNLIDWGKFIVYQIGLEYHV